MISLSCYLTRTRLAPLQLLKTLMGTPEAAYFQKCLVNSEATNYTAKNIAFHFIRFIMPWKIETTAGSTNSIIVYFLHNRRLLLPVYLFKIHKHCNSYSTNCPFSVLCFRQTFSGVYFIKSLTFTAQNNVTK